MTRALLAFQLLLASIPSTAVATDGADDARRLTAILHYVAADYGGAVRDGQAVSQTEYAEQVDFLVDVATLAERLPPSSVVAPGREAALQARWPPTRLRTHSQSRERAGPSAPTSPLTRDLSRRAAPRSTVPPWRRGGRPRRWCPAGCRSRRSPAPPRRSPSRATGRSTPSPGRTPRGTAWSRGTGGRRSRRCFAEWSRTRTDSQDVRTNGGAPRKKLVERHQHVRLFRELVVVGAVVLRLEDEIETLDVSVPRPVSRQIELTEPIVAFELADAPVVERHEHPATDVAPARSLLRDACRRATRALQRAAQHPHGHDVGVGVVLMPGVGDSGWPS
jgi:hypothetical protein